MNSKTSMKKKPGRLSKKLQKIKEVQSLLPPIHSIIKYRLKEQSNNIWQRAEVISKAGKANSKHEFFLNIQDIKSKKVECICFKTMVEEWIMLLNPVTSQDLRRYNPLKSITDGSQFVMLGEKYHRNKRYPKRSTSSPMKLAPDVKNSKKPLLSKAAQRTGTTKINSNENTSQKPLKEASQNQTSADSKENEHLATPIEETHPSRNPPQTSIPIITLPIEHEKLVKITNESNISYNQNAPTISITRSVENQMPANFEENDLNPSTSKPIELSSKKLDVSNRNFQQTTLSKTTKPVEQEKPHPLTNNIQVSSLKSNQQVSVSIPINQPIRNEAHDEANSYVVIEEQTNDGSIQEDMQNVEIPQQLSLNGKRKPIIQNPNDNIYLVNSHTQQQAVKVDPDEDDDEVVFECELSGNFANSEKWKSFNNSNKEVNNVKRLRTDISSTRPTVPNSNRTVIKPEDNILHQVTMEPIDQSMHNPPPSLFPNANLQMYEDDEIAFRRSYEYEARHHERFLNNITRAFTNALLSYSYYLNSEQ